jgi:hypothetical protein
MLSIFSRSSNFGTHNLFQSIPIFSCTYLTYLKLVPQTLLIPGWPQVKQRLNLVIFNAAGTAAGSNGAHWQMAVQHLKKLGVC